MTAVCPTGFGSTPSLVLDDMVPIGGIINWSGAIVDIPERFQLCDGTNGTPDLRNKFVIGAGDTHAVDDTGGTIDHAHDGTFAVQTAGTGPSSAWDITQPSSTVDNLPPFLALAYIQRMT